MEIFLELSSVIFIATVVSIVLRVFKQPLIVGYLLTGIICGPYVFNLLHSENIIEIFSKIGVIILLFIVGLNLNPQVIREVGKVSVAAGIGQILLTTIVGFVIALTLGLSHSAALYVSIALTLSSTIIILKLLSDKGDINSLYGKIAVGLLIVQDITATVVLLVVSSFQNPGGAALSSLILLTVLKGVGLLVALFLLSKYFIHRVVAFVAQSQELLFLFSISWGLAISSLFYVVGFSVEIGALVAGVTLAVTPYAFEISSRLKPLRDFFVLLFFILLGSQMTFDNLNTLAWPAIILSLFVLIGNPIIMIVIMNLLGFSKKVGFKTGLTVGQISEFSLILATLGFQIGHIDKNTLSLITFVGLITISGSTYLIMYDDAIYARVARYLRFLEFRKIHKSRTIENEVYEAILFGYHRVGQEFVKAFHKLKHPFIVVDFNPESINRLEAEGLPYKYGDAEDIEFLEELDLENAKLIVSTIPDHNINSLLVERIRERNKKAIVLCLSHDTHHAHELYKLGVNYVIMPHYLGARYASHLISKLDIDTEGFDQEKEKHMKYLKKHGGM